jgi:hypothetical protein
MAQLHHYISQFYLRNFSPDTSSGKIWVFEKPGDKLKLLSIKKHVAAIDNYYSIELDDGEKSNLLEQELSKVEKDASKVIKRIKNENYIFSKEELYIILHYGAVTFLRIPAFRDNTENFTKEVFSMVGKMLASDENNLRKIVEELPLEKIDKSKIDYKKLREFMSDPQKYVISIHQNKSIEDFLKLIPSLLDVLIKINWALYFIKGLEYFITSDRPIFPVVRNSNLPYSPGFANADLIIFPLTKKICLYGIWKRKPINIIIEREIVNSINAMIIHNSYKFIYSPLNRPELTNQFDESKNQGI